MRVDTSEVWAAAFVAQAAQEVGLPPGNLWEQGATRCALRLLKELGGDREAAADVLRHAWGLGYATT